MITTMARWGMIATIAMFVGACGATPPAKSSEKAAAKGSNLSGEWVLTTESQMGAQDAKMLVRQTGNALAGTLTSQAGSVDYTGTVNGQAVAFDFIINVQGTDLKLDYSGTVQGDTMQGKAVFGQFGEGTFTAKRKK